MITKLRFWGLLIGLFVFNLLAGAAGRKSDKKYNVLFIFADDQRFNTIHSLGVPEVATPNLDRLVNSGVSFSNCYIAGAPHGAVCSPSRAMLMTGRYYWNLPTAVHSMWAPEVTPETRGRCDYITMPQYFKENGYYTFATGKQHNGTHWIEDGFDEAKGVFLGGMSVHFGIKMKDYDPGKGWSGVYSDKRFSSEVFSEKVIDFLSNYNKEKPFFVYLSFTSPHDPRTAPQEFHDKYKGEDMTLPPNFYPEHPFKIGDMQIRDERLAAFPRIPEEVKKHLADYYAMIEANDTNIGKVLKALEESGKADNTIIVFSGDNGLAVGQHGLMGKQSVYEHSIKVPLILNGPKIKRGKKSPALVYLHDLFPTLCDLNGLEVPKTVESKSFVRSLQKPKASHREALHFAYSSWRFEKVDGKPCPRGHHRAVRKGDWKLILSLYEEKMTPQLFNLKTDPWEKNNLYNDPKYQDKGKELMAELKKEVAQTNDYVELDKPDWGFQWGGEK